MRRPAGALGALALLLVLFAASAVAQPDPMRAPPDSELDREADEWVRRRRTMAILILTLALIGGGLSSVVRRRARKRAALAVEPSWPDTATIRSLSPPLRMDRLRKALRAGMTPPAEELPALNRLFHEDTQAPLRVLILEALVAGAAPVDRALLDEALRDPADSVRIAAAQIILGDEPGRQVEFAREHLADPGVELRTLCAEILAPHDPDAAANAMLDLVRAEAGGPRESHCLRRAMTFFVEELGDPARAASIEALAGEVDDEEGMIPWALKSLRPGQT